MIEYFADNLYSPENDRSIRYNDPQIGINWPINDVILSDKDKNAPFVADIDNDF